MVFMTGEYERFVEEQSVAREEELLQLNVNNGLTVESAESLADVSRSENKVNNRIF